MAQGEITNPENDREHLKDLRFNELLMVLPLVLLFFVIGLFPNLFFDKINPSVEALVVQQQAAHPDGRGICWPPVAGRRRIGRREIRQPDPTGAAGVLYASMWGWP